MSRFAVTLAIPDGTGAAAMVVAYATAICSRGHDVTLFHGPLPPSQQHGESRSRQMLAELGDAGVELIELDGLQSTYRMGVVRRLANEIKDARIDAVIAFQQLDRKFALAAAKRVGVPCLVSAQNQHHFWGPRPLPWLKERAYARLLRRNAAMVACTSEVVRSEVVERFRVKPRRTRVIPNGLRPHPYVGPSGATTRAELGLEPNDIVAVNVGRLDIQKGQDVLIDALALLDTDTRASLRVVFVGDRPDTRNRSLMSGYSARLVDSVSGNQLGSNVTFTGWRDDVPALLECADFYIHPSRWEGWPVAVLEAMAAGKGVIMTDCAGRPLGFEDGVHGYVVPSESPTDLATAIEKMVNLSPDDRALMGHAARSLQHDRYHLDTLATEFVELLESLGHPGSATNESEIPK